MIDKLGQLESNLNLPSPIQEITQAFLDNHNNVKVYLKRDDLIHPAISGNKYRKLKGYLQHYLNSNIYDGIITFGGAFSNHLYATTAACKLLNIPLYIIVRGLHADLNNHTLSCCIGNGDSLHLVSFEEYREKERGDTYQSLVKEQPLLSIPEGGAGSESLIGINDLAIEINDQVKPDYLALCSGTGTTASGLMQSSLLGTQFIIASCVRDQSVESQLRSIDPSAMILHERWGGFAKRSLELDNFIKDFNARANIPIEFVYTGKLFFEIDQLLIHRKLDKNSVLLLIHTGGLRPSKN